MHLFEQMGATGKRVLDKVVGHKVVWQMELQYLQIFSFQKRSHYNGAVFSGSITEQILYI
jgi:hypothetical protein